METKEELVNWFKEVMEWKEEVERLMSEALGFKVKLMFEKED